MINSPHVKNNTLDINKIAVSIASNNKANDSNSVFISCQLKFNLRQEFKKKAIGVSSLELIMLH